MKKLIVGIGAALILGGVLAGAGVADTDPQNIDATLSESITLSLSDPNVAFTLLPSGANTAPAGTATVTSNSPYTVTVQSDGATLREWDTATSAYVAGGSSLASAPSIAVASSSGTGAAGVGGPVTNVGPTAVAAGVGLGTDVFDLTVNQATTIADAALPVGHTYHAQFTYTAANTI